MMTRPTILMTLIALPLAGCAAGPDYRPKGASELGVPSAYSVEARQEAQADLRQWWAVFDDPLLTRLVEQAATQNLDVARLWPGCGRHARRWSSRGPRSSLMSAQAPGLRGPKVLPASRAARPASRSAPMSIIRPTCSAASAVVSRPAARNLTPAAMTMPRC
ncbi:nodulation protein T [Ditylenchus destructor]|uniref:Nodulation protein T n=1 Tax=Ditylenchus destructor TaxID=166010 RepID=A0AAD4MH03_9BILA|nr:nodulation protein T [Ditylenchus destructor]